ncbi:MAG: 4-(cytidine 5'-diphospho)-2-C-methyl-D-erythritol kinase [Tepidisphaeraceae bacterium]|jgi:4-diphosphocytidyl-2-C-methyl-D-erythritol kinase
MDLPAPAKINLHLRVGNLRSDGFHPLLSWMVTVGLFDRLSIEQSDVPGIRLTCDDAGIPTDANNLVVKTAVALADWLAAREPGMAKRGINVRLKKTIPAGAGLGGGSSDGAMTLQALNAMWRLGLSDGELAEFAGRFGSDLSFFFFQPSAVCRGRGEIVRPLPRPRACWAALLLPHLHMPTPAVYRRFDELGLGSPINLSPEPDLDDWALLEASDLLCLLRNDLEPAAFSIAPALGELRQAAECRLTRPVRMSGSGSSLFTLYDEAAAAVFASRRIADEFHVTALAVEIGPKLDP